MTSAGPKLLSAEAFGLNPFCEHVARGMRDLFRPLNDLLISGRDPGVIGTSRADREITGRHCLLGQPVTIDRADGAPSAVLRLCIGARLVIRAWSRDTISACRNPTHQLDRIAGVIAKIELLQAHAGTTCLGHSNGV
jgi:hypothetical protein